MKEKQHWNRHKIRTDTFLGIFQEFHKPKPRTQPENPCPEERNAKGVTEILELGNPAGGNTFRGQEE